MEIWTTLGLVCLQEFIYDCCNYSSSKLSTIYNLLIYTCHIFSASLMLFVAAFLSPNALSAFILHKITQ